MTQKEQYIYNCYLETSRKLNNQPFRYRKNFDKFEEKEEYVYVSRLCNFFNKFDNINIKDFFEAPYFVYNEKQFDLKFFTGQKAIKAYTIYQNKFLVDNPDNDQTLLKIKEGYEFIYKFCKQNNVKLVDYALFKTPGSMWHDFMMHVKNRNVIIYCMFLFNGFDKALVEYDRELKEFTFGDIFININFYRTKYHASKKAKKLCNLILNKLTSSGTTVL